jgi:hypothetical protein
MHYAAAGADSTHAEIRFHVDLKLPLTEVQI